MIHPPGDGNGTEGEQDLARYRRIWWYVVGLMLLVSVSPLVIMTELNHYMYRRALRSETRSKVSRTLANVSRPLEFVVEERVSALELLVEAKGLEELRSDGTLAATLGNLKRSFGGFVDLGVIGPNGIQEQYVGPYDLRGIDYEEEEWFREVRVRGVHVSEVFLGHRRLPHFVIAIRSESEGGSLFALRATVDMDLLTDLVFVPDLGPRDDVFIVSRYGVLQTPSRRHGAILEASTLPVPPLVPDLERIEEHRENGESFLLGYRAIAKTPFVLIVLRSSVGLPEEWRRTRAESLAILVIGTALIALVAVWSATYMVRQIRTADRRRAEMLHRMEFTAKMATIGRLAASVAHEINNPLAIINEKAGLLRDLVEGSTDHPHRDRTLKGLDSISKSVDRCSRVTHRLLGFTRRMEGGAEAVSLPELLQEVLGFTGKEAIHRNISVETRFTDDVPPVWADRGQLQQVFLNIINNAFAAVEDGGRIEMTVRPAAAGRVEAIVRDDGSGIPEEKLRYVFEPFFSTKGEFGTGLGLSITYDLVQKMGGRIDIASKPGRGTAVTVELPASSSSGRKA